jgi:tetratricopeptide (TPR) repeat protein
MKSAITQFVLGFAIVCFGIATPILSAADPAAAFTQANKLYEQGKYADAASAYETLIKTGVVSPALLFNLGDARSKAGQTGLAIAAYRQAQRLAPRDPDIRANLQFARTQAQGGVSPQSGATIVHRLNRLTLNEWSVLTSVFFIGWCLLFAITQWNPESRQRLRSAKILLGCLGALMLIATALTYRSQQLTQTAIVAVPEAVMRLGPFGESQSAFTARDGTELEIIGQRQGWWQVIDSSGRSGWIPTLQAVLDPPQTLSLR